MDSGNGTQEVENSSSIHCMSMFRNREHGIDLFLQIVLTIDVIVGLPGSIIALWIFWFRLKVWKAHVLFLFNMVLADFLLLLSVPLRIDTHLRGETWVHGPVWCTINLFMLSVNRSASIAFMTVVALDRYFKVVHPHHWISRITVTRAGVISGLMWFTVLLFRIPLLTTKLLHEDGNVSLCGSFFTYRINPLPVKVHYTTFLVEFFLPWFVLLFCSARIAFHLSQGKIGDKKRVNTAIRAVAVISLVFTFGFMPSVITGLLGLQVLVFHPTDCKSYNRITQLFVMCFGFTYLNSALDPIVYCYSSSMFRAAVKKLFCCKKKPRQGL